MNELHKYYLNIGSNIEPEINLPKTLELLAEKSAIQAKSSVWESNPVGAAGSPNFLNVCVLITTPLELKELKENILRLIEARLGRHRGKDKNAPRTIDIDVVMADGEPLAVDRWDNPFIVLPMAELEPEFIHPTKQQMLSRIAENMMSNAWIVRRMDVLRSSR